MRGGTGPRTAKSRRRGGSWPTGDGGNEVGAAAGAERRGGRRGRGAGTRETRGRPRGSGAAGAGVASGPPGTRRRCSARGGREDDEACGTAGQDDDATRGIARGARAGRGRRWRRRRRASTGAGARPDVDLKLVRCGREGRGIVGGGGKVSAGWPYQPALSCHR